MLCWEGYDKASGEYKGIGGETTFRGCRDTATSHLPTVLLIESWLRKTEMSSGKYSNPFNVIDSKLFHPLYQHDSKHPMILRGTAI